MYIITSKEDNTVLSIGENLEYQTNGYPVLVDQHMAFPDWMVNVHTEANIPAEVKSEKYCYTPEEGFYENPDWKEPNKYGLTDEQIATIEQDYRDRLAAEVQEV